MNIRFPCPVCERPSQSELPAPSEWQCPACDHLVQLAPPSERVFDHCALCGNRELYRKKDFPHWLGLSILTVACLAFIGANYLHHQWFAWGILIASAIGDGLLYLLVGDVVVCYRCGAQYRGFPVNLAHLPFDLGTAERYRQERVRRENMTR